MSYSKTTWTNGTTPINETNLNKIEQGIYDVEQENIIVSATEPSTDRRKMWIKYSKNLFDKSSNIKVGYLDASGNVVTSDTTLSYQDSFIKVKPSTVYTISSSGSTIFRICEYSKSLGFIVRQLNVSASTSYTFTTGANTYFIKMGGVTTTSIETLQLEQGGSKTDYVDYAEHSINIKNDNNVYNELDINKLDTRVSSLESTDRTIYANDFKCKNIFYSRIVQGVVDDTGIASSTTRLATQDFIKVEPNTTYTISFSTTNNINNVNVSYFTSASFPRSGQTGWLSNFTFTTGTTTNYILISFRNSDNATISTTNISNIQLELGNTATRYTEYKNFSGETYSTNEQVIGTWMGKPLYRKIATGNVSISANTWTNLRYKSGEESLVKCYISDDENFDGTNIPALIKFSGNYLQVYSPIALTLKCSIVEYTKTTD